MHKKKYINRNILLIKVFTFIFPGGLFANLPPSFTPLVVSSGMRRTRCDADHNVSRVMLTNSAATRGWALLP